ncbi:hypothetical protein BH11VER1_BH11VER1_13850 [soil metagenome]
MKFLAIFLTISFLALITYLMVDARSELKGARNQLEIFRHQQQAVAATPAPTLAEQELAHKEQLLLLEQANKANPITPTNPPPSAFELPNTPAAPVVPIAPPPLTPNQRMILAAPAIAKISEYVADGGFVVISAGATRKLEVGMKFAIRRGNAIIGRIKVTSLEDGSAIADLPTKTIPQGVNVEAGDDVIQDLAPLQ